MRCHTTATFRYDADGFFIDLDPKFPVDWLATDHIWPLSPHLNIMKGGWAGVCNHRYFQLKEVRQLPSKDRFQVVLN